LRSIVFAHALYASDNSSARDIVSYLPRRPNTLLHFQQNLDSIAKNRKEKATRRKPTQINSMVCQKANIVLFTLYRSSFMIQKRFTARNTVLKQFYPIYL